MARFDRNLSLGATVLLGSGPRCCLEGALGPLSVRVTGPRRLALRFRKAKSPQLTAATLLLDFNNAFCFCFFPFP